MQVHAAVMVRNLSVNSDSEIKIVQEGALPPLINLLRRLALCVCVHVCLY